LCCVVLCCVVLCCVVLCCVVLSCVVLCCVMLCYVVLLISGGRQKFLHLIDLQLDLVVRNHFPFFVSRLVNFS